MQPESVSVYNPCHTPQNTTSLKYSLCGSSGINGDVDIFRQTIYLILMLSNRSQSPPHGATEPPRHRPRCLSITLVFLFKTLRIPNNGLCCCSVSCLFCLSLSSVFLTARLELGRFTGAWHKVEQISDTLQEASHHGINPWLRAFS